MICLPVKQSDQKLGLFMKTINNLHEILKEHKNRTCTNASSSSSSTAKIRSSDMLTIYLQTDIKTHPSVIVAVHKVIRIYAALFKHLASAVKEFKHN
jgi:hypothetical protein